MTEESISDVFEAEPEVITEEAKGEEVKPVEPETPEPTEEELKGEEQEPQEEDEPGPPPEEEQPEVPKTVPRRALEDERGKRQALQQQNESLQEENKQLKNQLHIPDESAPDPVEDPEGYESHLKAKWEQEARVKKSDDSRSRMLEKHEDYVEKEKTFVFLCQQDPSLVNQLDAHPDPAAFAYETASEYINAEHAKIKEQVMQELEKEGKLVSSQPNVKKPEVPEVSSLINSSGAGKNTESPVSEVSNIGDVF